MSTRLPSHPPPVPNTNTIPAWRLLTSSLFHTGGIHLLFNMVALLQVGVPLERLLGSVQLSWLVATLSVLSNCLYVGLALAAGLPPLGWV